MPETTTPEPATPTPRAEEEDCRCSLTRMCDRCEYLNGLETVWLREQRAKERRARGRKKKEASG